MDSVPATLRAWRAAARLEQAEIATLLRRSRQLISAWETERQPVPVEQIAPFGRACKRSEEEIGLVVLAACGVHANTTGNVSNPTEAAA